MKRFLQAVCVTSALGLSLSAHAAEYYPKQVSLRTFGSNQGDVADCESEAEVGALENVFANQGLGFVKLSLFYRHAAIYVDEKPDLQKEVSLSLNPADVAFIKKAGPLLPDYMWPEDGSGYELYASGVRPHPSEAVLWDGDFPAGNAFGFSEAYFSFTPGYSNTRGLADLKGAVSGGSAVILSLHGDLFQPGNGKIVWDGVTGFLKTPYSWTTLQERVRASYPAGDDGIHHAVMVVGFDDALYTGAGYANPGALIIRNSWNDRDTVTDAMAHPTPEQQSDLEKMRLKVYSENLPGYYAIPYQYVLDLVVHGQGGFTVFNLNYSAFAQKYQELSGRYETVMAPFVCDEAYTETARSSDPARREVRDFGQAYQVLTNPHSSGRAKAQASQAVYDIAMRETRRQVRGADPNAKSSVFNYALLPHHLPSQQNRTTDFYSGKFREYYCPEVSDPGAGVWPSNAEFANAGFQEGLGDLSDSRGTLAGWYSFLRSLSTLQN